MSQFEVYQGQEDDELCTMPECVGHDEHGCVFDDGDDDEQQEQKEHDCGNLYCDGPDEFGRCIVNNPYDRFNNPDAGEDEGYYDDGDGEY